MAKLLIAVAALACMINMARAATPGQLYAMADQNRDFQLDLGELSILFNEFDTNNNNQVTFSEFSQKWIQEGLGSNLQAIGFFNGLDANGDGYVDMANDRIGFGYFDRQPEDNAISYIEFVSRFP